MTSEKDKTKQQILSHLDKIFKVEKNQNRYFNLNDYSRGLHGKYLKITSVRKILDFPRETFHIFYQDSHEIEVNGTVPGYSDIKTDLITYHDAVLIKFDSFLPDLTIRPNNINEKVANLFLRFDIKLKNRKRFNNLYVLESNTNSEKLERLLSVAITDELILYNNLNIDFKNQSILLRFDEEVNKENSTSLIKLAKLIQSEF
ncbi:hypothetical protein AAON49_12120 [Pseudotenacibaculum sp. MALMAid0570]|uniref:hypothetical protein n=1 Tax=Pseudotenacibaculum sp. MALMAid0570 TaxID=3143938 RepID=UPI0032DF9E14